MSITYFKRFRMEYDFSEPIWDWSMPPGYQLVAFDESLVRDHATAKYRSFAQEIDTHVFPCLGRRDGCLRLIREITGRASFVPEATWLLRYRDPISQVAQPVGTVQGIHHEGWGAIQNLGIDPMHRGRGLGRCLLGQAAQGFRSVGLSHMHLEVTMDNTGAVRLYERLGFKRANTVYKAAEVAGI
jgi:hypothetical protein